MRPSGIKKRSRKPRSGSAASRATHASREIMEADDIMRASRSNTKGHARSWNARWCRFQVQKLVPGITNRYCSPSFETAPEPVIGRAFARPVGGLLRMRSNLLKHNNLMLRSERRERLEAWAASDSPSISTAHRLIVAMAGCVLKKQNG